MRPIASASCGTASIPNRHRFAATTCAASRSPKERTKSLVRGVISSVYATPYRRRSSFVARPSIAPPLPVAPSRDFGKRSICLRRRSATNESISFSSRGRARIVTRVSVTPEIADTTRNFRVRSSWTTLAIRSYMSPVLTQFPPNFATFHGSVKVPSPVCELRVEHAPARAATNRVVR